MQNKEPIQAEESFPSITCRDRSPVSWRAWGRLAGVLGLLWGLVALFTWWIFPTPSMVTALGALVTALGALLAISGFMGIALLGTVFHAHWPRRRQALRVDEEGVHEVFRHGSRRSLAWKEIDRLEQRKNAWNSSWWVLHPRDPGTPALSFSGRVEDAHQLAALIQARLHGLPVVPSSSIPVPTREEIEAFFGRPVPVRWFLFPTLLIAGLAGAFIAVLTYYSLSFNPVFPWEPAPAWPVRLLASLLSGITLSGLALMPAMITSLVSGVDSVSSLLHDYRVFMDEDGIELRGLFGSRQRLAWREIVGREAGRLRGVHHDLVLPNFFGFKRVMKLVDSLIERRQREGGMPAPKLSTAALTLAESEAGEPSEAALTEAETPSVARMTGKELEEPGREVANRAMGKHSDE